MTLSHFSSVAILNHRTITTAGSQHMLTLTWLKVILVSKANYRKPDKERFHLKFHFKLLIVLIDMLYTLN